MSECPTQPLVGQIIGARCPVCDHVNIVHDLERGCAVCAVWDLVDKASE